MKRLILVFLSALGVHKLLSAEQKQDIAEATMRLAPGVAGSGASKAMGVEIGDVVALATLVFVVLQAAHLVWKWRRQARIDAMREAKGKVPTCTDWGDA